MCAVMYFSRNINTLVCGSCWSIVEINKSTSNVKVCKYLHRSTILKSTLVERGIRRLNAPHSFDFCSVLKAVILIMI